MLATLPDQSVQCVVTSPPYYQLRDYGIDGQIGLEQSLEDYINALVETFRGVHRVLHDTGTLWLNIGDTYASAWPCNRRNEIGAGSLEDGSRKNRPPRLPAGLKEKDLMGVPWRLVLALQADGWYLRSDIIWQKPNCMPEPVRDRPTKAHEYVFLLTKQPRYFYDAEAVKEPNSDDMQKRAAKGHTRGARGKLDASRNDHDSLRGEHTKAITATGRNRRTVWTVATKSFRGAHFAVMPEALVEPCINAGTSEKGQCPACGAPWQRQLKRTSMVIARTDRGERMGEFGRTQASGTMVSPPTSETIGWEPTCDCDAGDPVPQIVLDPFFGSGTVGVVAQRLGRACVGIELNAEYIELAEQRLAAA